MVLQRPQVLKHHKHEQTHCVDHLKEEAGVVWLVHRALHVVQVVVVRGVDPGVVRVGV